MNKILLIYKVFFWEKMSVLRIIEINLRSKLIKKGVEKIFGGIKMAKPENMQIVPEITSKELSNKRAKKEDFVLLDVREEDERKLSRIGNDLFIPMSVLSGRFK